MVEWLFRKPNWLPGRFVSITGSKRLRVSFSNTLEKIGSKLIILYGLVESEGFPDFSIIIMIENFQRTRKYGSLSMELYMCVSDKIAFLGSWVVTSDVMRSYPGVLCRAVFLILYSISLGLMCFGGRVRRRGLDRKWSNSSILLRGMMLLCG